MKHLGTPARHLNVPVLQPGGGGRFCDSESNSRNHPILNPPKGSLLDMIPSGPWSRAVSQWMWMKTPVVRVRRVSFHALSESSSLRKEVTAGRISGTFPAP